jgi:general nucleoside transport system permease protein
MAVPTVQQSGPEQRTPAANLPLRLRKLGASIGRPVFAVVLAMVAGIIVIMITSPGSLGDRFTEAISAYQALFSGSFGSLQSLSYTLVNVTPLIFAGLSVAIAFRAGLFNIGAEGQLAVGALTACAIGIKGAALPGWLLIIIMIVASALAGAIWGGIVGFLKAWRGAHEVVTTIMLNWIAFFVADYLINGPLLDPSLANSTKPLPPQATFPEISVFYNHTLGTFLPQIAGPQAYLADVTFFFALIALVVYWFLISRTTFGYEARVIGQNPKAAKYAGISTKRNIFLVMAIAGAFAGLGGAFHLMGQFPYYLTGSTFRIDTVGFDAIGVALLGHGTAIGIFFASLLFGGLRQGAGLMQLSANVPGDLVYIIQALVLFSIAAEFLPAIQRRVNKWMIVRRGKAVVATGGGLTVVDLAENANGSAQNGESANGASQKGDLTAEHSPGQMHIAEEE